jgi:hypothetical protein
MAFVPGKPFQPSLMFAISSEHTRVKNLSGSALNGRILASPTNIRLDWKGFLETSIIAYYKNA